MRRSDKEVRDFNEILAIIERCEVCRISLNDNGYPYIVPLNFGYCVENGVLSLYFHGAMQGKKLDLIRSDNRAGFEMDCSCELVPRDSEGECTMAYESVMGRGRVELVPDDEKIKALGVLMGHYHKGDFTINTAVAQHTCAFRLIVEEITAKRNSVRK
ncbi:MAG: pyridoxamine 5'-phosphate oxidase family protein [Clostridia bacterium]|nr:pyridoxamine 5'-phosphate oxidase family protein [Clostridia bacterium]